MDVIHFKSGGEGDIYHIVGMENKLAKIYHPHKLTDKTYNKIKYMINNPPSASILSQIAWALDIIQDNKRNFLGFVMNKLDVDSELTNLYAYPQTNKGISYKNKITIAKNICVVISEVHDAGYIFGDFNPRNIGVNTNNGMVGFFDTDSYHFKNKKTNEFYRCEVCFDGYQAPELINHVENYKPDAYANAPLPTFTKETDNFALAIHIFKLLMNGFTPFSGVINSIDSPGIGSEAIKRGNYCFKPGYKPQSVAVPPVTILSKEIADLFTRAFMSHRRPDAKEWYVELTKYEKQLVQCSVNKVHQYKQGLNTCPWCMAKSKYDQSVYGISNFAIKSIKFFEGPDGKIPNHRIYSNTFTKSARIIYFELRFPAFKQKSSTTINLKVFFNGNQIYKCSKSIIINKDSNRFVWGWGYVWQAGTYIYAVNVGNSIPVIGKFNVFDSTANRIVK